MDRFSLRAANLIVGNEEGAAGLEVTFLGPKLEFLERTTIAVTGGDMPIFVNGKEHASWQPITVEKGQLLEFGYIKNGARIYIAFSGGIDVPEVLGSRSTYTVGVLGGYKGRVLMPGDMLTTFKNSAHIIDDISIPLELRPTIGELTELRVLPGLYWHRLTEEAGLNFFDDQWHVTSEADRMGYRFAGGRPMQFVERKQPFGAGADPSNIVDSAYPYGSIQIPGGLEPIVLHRDAVSAGGYFQVGTVISADMDRVGQLQPNKKVRFVKVSMEEALVARRNQSEKLKQVRSLLGCGLED